MTAEKIIELLTELSNALYRNATSSAMECDCATTDKYIYRMDGRNEAFTESANMVMILELNGH